MEESVDKSESFRFRKKILSSFSRAMASFEKGSLAKSQEISICFRVSQNEEIKIIFLWIVETEILTSSLRLRSCSSLPLRTRFSSICLSIFSSSTFILIFICSLFNSCFKFILFLSYVFSVHVLVCLCLHLYMCVFVRVHMYMNPDNENMYVYTISISPNPCHIFCRANASNVFYTNKLRLIT